MSESNDHKNVLFSVVLHMFDIRNTNFVLCMYIKHTYKLISFLIDVEPFKNLVMSTLAESADSPEHFSKLVRTMSITRHQVWKIEAATVKQSDSPLWKLLRHGRITASNFYQMKTRMESQDFSTAAQWKLMQNRHTWI